MSFWSDNYCLLQCNNAQEFANILLRSLVLDSKIISRDCKQTATVVKNENLVLFVLYE